MKVCLVSPATVTEFENPAVAEQKAGRLTSQHAPLGILTLAAILESRGIQPHIVDLNRLYDCHFRAAGPGADFSAYAVRELASQACDVFGFGTICSSYPLTLRLATELKRERPEAFVMLGGPQASATDLATLQAFPCVDLIVRGEAEETLPLVLESLGRPRRWSRIPGITWRAGRTADAPLIADLDRLPTPAFHLYPEIRSCPNVPLELGRGCPFGCRFCSTSAYFRRRFRLKSPRRMLEEMRAVRDATGASSFELVHDMFTVDRRRVIAFCEALLASGESFRWNCSARTDCVDRELLALMRRAGCWGIFFGIETGSALLQRAVQKNLDLAEAARRIGDAVEAEIRPTVSLITGFPTETRDDLRDTAAFLMDALRYEAVKPQLHLLAPLAGTPLYGRHRGELVLDDIFSDISHHGWRQHPLDLELIRSHPEVFPSFYAFPTPALDRSYARELRDFLLHGALRSRWLMVALHQSCGGLQAVFDAWQAWRAGSAGTTAYYMGPEFPQELVEFARRHYAARSAALTALIELEEALHAVSGTAPTSGNGSVPRIAPGVRVVHLSADLQQILECLRDRQDLAAVPAQSMSIAARLNARRCLEIVRLTPLSAQILSLCDGRRTPRAIARKLHLDGVPSLPACRFALQELKRQGLVEWVQGDEFY